MPIETIEDHHIKIKPSSKLIEYVAKNLKSVKDLPENIKLLKNNPHQKRADCHLLLDDIKWLKSHLSEQPNGKSKKIYLHDLLESSDILLPQPKVTPRDPKLEARIKKLQAQQENRDYKAMTKGVDASRKHMPEDSIGYQIKIMNKQLIAVAQFIFSVAAGFAFGFIGIELLLGNLDFGFRLLLGIMCALIVALAEIYFLAKKLSEDYEEKPHQE